MGMHVQGSDENNEQAVIEAEEEGREAAEEEPTEAPTEEPTEKPTVEPTVEPTLEPSSEVTVIDVSMSSAQDAVLEGGVYTVPAGKSASLTFVWGDPGNCEAFYIGFTPDGNTRYGMSAVVNTLDTKDTKGFEETEVEEEVSEYAQD